MNPETTSPRTPQPSPIPPAQTPPTLATNSVEPPAKHGFSMSLLLKLFGLLVIVVVVLSLVLVGISWWRTHQKQHATQTYLASINDTSVVPVITEYLAAREDAAGADQATPTSWINQVKSISTGTLFNTLVQSKANTMAAANKESFVIAHTYNYVVKVTVNECIIDNSISQATKTSEYVDCALTDAIVNPKTGDTVSNTALIANDWSKFGVQSPHPTLQMIMQNGKWLVANDLSGQGD
jgi:cytoskeletal protein RodZ